MKIHLTELAVKKLSPPLEGQVTYWDDATPGFGLRLSPRAKSYVVMYGQKRQLKTLGRYPELSLSDARKRAKLFLAAHLANPDPDATFDYEAVLAEYLADCRKRLRASTMKGYSLYLGHIRFKGLIGDIKPSQVMAAIGKYTDHRSSQNYAFTTFKVFFSWAVRRQYLKGNPLLALKRPNKTTSRERVLSEEEVRTLLDHTLANRSRFNDVVSLLLLTGQRKSEISDLRWSEVDGETLSLPAIRTKNKRAHQVPICKLARHLLETIDGGSTFVFGTSEADAPFNGWNRAQLKLLADSGLQHFTLHDLRRTFATTHAKLGTPVHVTERLLNHASGTVSGVAAVYNRHSYQEEMRLAVDRFGAFVEELVRAGQGASASHISRDTLSNRLSFLHLGTS
jgi:integrase